MAPRIPTPELDHEKIKESKKDWLPVEVDPDSDQDHEIPREERGEPSRPPIPPSD
jgi:hypothetical protein